MNLLEKFKETASSVLPVMAIVLTNDLGVAPEFLGKDDIQLDKKESVEDTAKGRGLVGQGDGETGPGDGVGRFRRKISRRGHTPATEPLRRARKNDGGAASTEQAASTDHEEVSGRVGPSARAGKLPQDLDGARTRGRSQHCRFNSGEAASCGPGCVFGGSG